MFLAVISQVCTGDLMKFCPVPINDNTRPYLALGAMTALLLFLAMIAVQAYYVVDYSDQKASKAWEELSHDPDNASLISKYDDAAREYIGATIYFPGNIIAMGTGRSPEKWQMTNQSKYMSTSLGVYLEPRELDTKSLEKDQSWTPWH